jgi:cytochrome c peroxidase
MHRIHTATLLILAAAITVATAAESGNEAGPAAAPGAAGRDFNRIKGPVLRGLAARAPYFHNGAAADLKELVNFYDQRFGMNLTAQQKSDLLAFLNSL